MKTRASDVRESLVLGHELEVHLSDDGRWQVAVDGDEMLPRCVTPYAAWAVGAAESYRQGRTPGALPASVEEQRPFLVEVDRGFVMS